MLPVKKFINTLKNIWSIEELSSKILFTLMLIAIYRVGYSYCSYLVSILHRLRRSANSNGGILGLIDAFSGGAFYQASIFALGIMPYISASIFMQLMTILGIRRFRKCRKKATAEEKRSINIHDILRLVSLFYRHRLMLHILQPE